MVSQVVPAVAGEEEDFGQAEPSPCVRNCCLDEQNICLGCGRRLAEILEWHHADAQRRDVIRQSAQTRIQERTSPAG